MNQLSTFWIFCEWGKRCTHVIQHNAISFDKSLCLLFAHFTTYQHFNAKKAFNWYNTGSLSFHFQLIQETQCIRQRICPNSKTTIIFYIFLTADHFCFFVDVTKLTRPDMQSCPSSTDFSSNSVYRSWGILLRIWKKNCANLIGWVWRLQEKIWGVELQRSDVTRLLYSAPHLCLRPAARGYIRCY